MESKVYIIGIGFKPLTGRARELVLKAGAIVASRRLAQVFAGYPEYAGAKGRLVVINDVEETMAYLRKTVGEEGEPLVLLASGDPLFYGIARRTIKEMGQGRVEIIQDLTSIQIAFCRIKESWNDALLISLHGRGRGRGKGRPPSYRLEDLPRLTEEQVKIAVLTDGVNNPARIAGILAGRDLVLYVCERLGYPDEAIISGSPEELAASAFREPAVVIIKNLKNPEAQIVRFGRAEGEFHHSRGLITKDEVRAATLHKLRLPVRGILWDIGAGSGAVSIEASLLSPGLRIFAVERNRRELTNLRKNLARFAAAGVEPVKGEAPEVLLDLPAPDRVFIGGSGGRLREIVSAVARKEAKIIVINAVTLETLNEAAAALEENGYPAEITGLSVTKIRPLGARRAFWGQNPVFLIKGERDAG